MIKELRHFCQSEKRIISAIMAMVLVMSLLPEMTFSGEVQAADKVEIKNPVVDMEAMAAGKKVTWDCLYFGNYPQSEVENTDSEYSVLQSAEGWDVNGDIIVNGVKYRRILRENATYYESFDIGHYKWENNSTYHYFRYEPIKWRVLKVDSNKATILSEIALDDQRYDTANSNTTWETSTIRSWLNGYGADSNQEGTDYGSRNFLDSAFNGDEQKAIVETVVVNEDNLEYRTEGGNNTTDKVYLLSETEVYTKNAETYGFTESADICDEARRCKSSDYAKAMGVYSDYADEGNCYWWLRSPGKESASAVCVDNRGDVNNIGCEFNFEINNVRGVRVALNLNLSFLNLYNYSGTVCSDGTESEKMVVESIQSPRILSVSNLDARKTIWDCVYFGSYPQTEVTNTNSIYSQLELSEGWDENGDINIDGVKYRRMLKTDATCISESKGYYQWEDDTIYHYFRYEPIKWRVMEVNENQAMLLSDVVLDDQIYNTTRIYNTTWEISIIRSWLNGYGADYNNEGIDYSERNFLDMAFNSAEQEAILNTDVINADNLKYGTEGGNNTIDKVFLLSESEAYTKKAKKYGFVSEYYTTKNYIKEFSRLCKGSDYAKAMGVYSATSDSFKGGCNWWLRSSGRGGNRAANVNYGGYADNYGNKVDSNDIGVRVALNLNLSSSDLYTYAGTVCNDGTVNENREPTTEEVTTNEVRTKKSQILKVTKSYTKVYGAKPFRLNVKLTKGNGKLKYTSSNKNVAVVNSNGSVAIKGMGICTITVKASATTDYKSAAAKITITVKPKKNAVYTVKVSGAGSLRVTWKKDTSGTGYELQYSTSGKFKGKTTMLVNITKNKTTSYKIKKLAKGMKYYVRVRTYRKVKVDGKTKKLYGNWSAIKQSGKIK